MTVIKNEISVIFVLGCEEIRYTVGIVTIFVCFSNPSPSVTVLYGAYTKCGLSLC